VGEGVGAGVEAGVPEMPTFCKVLMSFIMLLDIFTLTSGRSSHRCKLLSALKNFGCSVET
jgi:hypothetical protein